VSDMAGEGERGEEPEFILPPMSIGAEVVEDYTMLRLTLKCHPMRLLRPALTALPSSAPSTPPTARLRSAKALLTVQDGAAVSVAGLVLCRQRPGSAKGMIFVTLEDETGTANVIVWPKSYERFRRQVLTARLMKVTGKLQREGIVLHVIVDHVENLSHLLDGLGEEMRPDSRDADGAITPDRPAAPPTPRRHPRDQAKVLFPSRDFH
ncbi:MAG: OB-fold nucleic acid binding domain-containing protein, partial [Proteobacteria bacterium]|nr:OB-fold nucleic acid binding domain-containing protein [Pseudomonadota bacterium]